MIAKDFPVEAVQWAQSIPDEAIRASAMERVGKQVRLRYPERAAELLGN